MITAV